MVLLLVLNLAKKISHSHRKIPIMPSTLTTAFGNSWQPPVMQSLGVKPMKPDPVVSKECKCDDCKCGSSRTVDTTKEPLGTTVRNVIYGTGEGNYVVQITIDQDDCHLICLFIGVFILAVLFGRSRKSPSPALP